MTNTFKVFTKYKESYDNKYLKRINNPKWFTSLFILFLLFIFIYCFKIIIGENHEK